jgi:hypothetical protein
VDEQLNALLLTYVPEFEGVVISYRRVHIHGEPLGCVNGLYPYVNFKVSADFIVFAPAVNSQLVGKIKNVGPDLINVLVHGLFTFVLDRTGIPEDYCFDPGTQTWAKGQPVVALPAIVAVKGGLSKTAKKKLIKAAQAQAIADDKQETSPSEAPGAEDSRLAPDMWLRFSILSLDLSEKSYQWKATLRGEALGVVPTVTPLYEPTAKETQADVEAKAAKEAKKAAKAAKAAEANGTAEVSESAAKTTVSEQGAEEGKTKIQGHKKQRVS